jgi:hypothetical protein
MGFLHKICPSLGLRLAIFKSQGKPPRESIPAQKRTGTLESAPVRNLAPQSQLSRAELTWDPRGRGGRGQAVAAWGSISVFSSSLGNGSRST